MYLCMHAYVCIYACVSHVPLKLTALWFLLDLVVMVAVALTSGKFDEPRSLLVAVAMATFEV